MSARPVYLHGYAVDDDGRPVGAPILMRTEYDRGAHAEHGGPSDIADDIAHVRGLFVTLTNERGEVYAAVGPNGWEYRR